MGAPTTPVVRSRFAGFRPLAGFGTALGWPMKVSPGALTVTLATSGLTGVAFGFFSSNLASKLDLVHRGIRGLR